MILELSVLGGAAALLFVAIRARREALLLAAVLAYAAATSWMLQRDLGLLLPALAIAIALGLFGIVVILRNSAEASTQKVTRRHGPFQVNTNKLAGADSIGS